MWSVSRKHPWASTIPLIYINDLPNSLKTSSPRMNVDDTNITLPGNCIRDIEETLNRDLMNIKDWLLANKLSLHVTFSLSLFLSFSLPFLSLHPPSRPVPLFLVSLCATLLAKNSLPNNYFMQCFLNTATQNPPQSQDLISMTHQCCP